MSISNVSKKCFKKIFKNSLPIYSPQCLYFLRCISSSLQFFGTHEPNRIFFYEHATGDCEKSTEKHFHLGNFFWCQV